MGTVRVYDVYNNKHDFPCDDKNHGREIAKRIITEGLWKFEGEAEVFYPVHQIIKVKVFANT